MIRIHLMRELPDKQGFVFIMRIGNSPPLSFVYYVGKPIRDLEGAFLLSVYKHHAFPAWNSSQPPNDFLCLSKVQSLPAPPLYLLHDRFDALLDLLRLRP